jgi:hypothetical protein|tara:strand:+ start:720 stop:1040 length:321 start_codon:yes stop_codon:yes gene_type:complete
LKKKKINELVIFEKFQLKGCQRKFKSQNKCLCYRHGPLYLLKQKIRKEAINLASFQLREKKVKAYSLKKDELEKLIKKKETRVKQKHWKTILKYSTFSILGFPIIN